MSTKTKKQPKAKEKPKTPKPPKPADEKKLPAIPSYGKEFRKVFRGLQEQGEPVEGLTFADLKKAAAEVFRLNVLRKAVWAFLRRWLGLNLAAFKVHPAKGGAFNEAFLGMPKAERDQWARWVLQEPPSDEWSRIKRKYPDDSPQRKDSAQIFFDLATLGNLPDAVLAVPLRTGYFRDPKTLDLLKLAKKDPKKALEQYLQRKGVVVKRAKVEKKPAPKAKAGKRLKVEKQPPAKPPRKKEKKPVDPNAGKFQPQPLLAPEVGTAS